MQETLEFIIGVHRDLSAAESDFVSVEREFGPSRARVWDGVVIAKKRDGTERIYRRTTNRGSDATATAADLGLATGLAVALFPSAWIGVGPPTRAASAEIAAAAACVIQGLGRRALGRLGEGLDAADAALIVAAPETAAVAARAAMANAESILSEWASVDRDLIAAVLAAEGLPQRESASFRT